MNKSIFSSPFIHFSHPFLKGSFPLISFSSFLSLTSPFFHLFPISLSLSTFSLIVYLELPFTIFLHLFSFSSFFFHTSQKRGKIREREKREEDEQLLINLPSISFPENFSLLASLICFLFLSFFPSPSFFSSLSFFLSLSNFRLIIFSLCKNFPSLINVFFFIFHEFLFPRI